MLQLEALPALPVRAGAWGCPPPPGNSPVNTRAEPQKSKGVKSPKSQSKSSLMPSPSSRPKW